MHRDIDELAYCLKMRTLRKNFIEEIKEAELRDLNYEEFLLSLLQK